MGHGLHVSTCLGFPGNDGTRECAPYFMMLSPGCCHSELRSGVELGRQCPPVRSAIRSLIQVHCVDLSGTPWVCDHELTDFCENMCFEFQTADL